MKGILGTKVGMTQVWQGDRLVPVTVILAGPCPVVQRKAADTDGYSAVQLGWEEKTTKASTKPELGHFKKSGVTPQRHLVEFRDFLPEADQVSVEIFEQGQKVDVTATSKGRGTAGVIKRWNFGGLPATHGVKKKHRSPGSIGQRKFPGRVYKGKKMAGHYGSEKVTTVGLELLEIRSDDNLLLIKGAIPGPNGGLVVVKDSKRKVN
ncbi:MAG: 50S ribosomal protein L3 [Trueperaceae bacterium]|nr:50S ribosomal protein L3 [Trueperaceae bacterium]